MIISKLVGGLGNQLFQWACARNLQKIYGHHIRYEDHIEASNRKRDIYKFPNIIFNDEKYINHKFMLQFRLNIKDIFSYEQFIKNGFSDINTVYYLDGYWQGLAYFKDIADELRNELQPSVEFIQINKKIIDEDSLSLHIRRTDYLQIQDYHPVQSLEYYKDAVELLCHTGTIYVFSDDIQWCKDNLKFDKMKFVNNEEPIIDLWFMSLCKKNVIANSTFSWWAAWLNNHPDKKVICPKNWFGPKAPYSDRDILDNDWIKL
jgi:hypothetical protein